MTADEIPFECEELQAAKAAFFCDAFPNFLDCGDWGMARPPWHWCRLAWPPNASSRAGALPPRHHA